MQSSVHRASNLHVHFQAMAECAASERKSAEEAVKGGQLTIERLEEETRRLESDVHEARKQIESLKVHCWLPCTFTRRHDAQHIERPADLVCAGCW